MRVLVSVLSARSGESNGVPAIKLEVFVNQQHWSPIIVVQQHESSDVAVVNLVHCVASEFITAIAWEEVRSARKGTLCIVKGVAHGEHDFQHVVIITHRPLGNARRREGVVAVAVAFADGGFVRAVHAVGFAVVHLGEVDFITVVALEAADFPAVALFFVGSILTICPAVVHVGERNDVAVNSAVDACKGGGFVPISVVGGFVASVCAVVLTVVDVGHRDFRAVVAAGVDFLFVGWLVASVSTVFFAIVGVGEQHFFTVIAHEDLAVVNIVRFTVKDHRKGWCVRVERGVNNKGVGNR